MKKILIGGFGLMALSLALIATPAFAATETVVSDTSVSIIGVYNKASGSTYVDLSGSPLNAVIAAEPASYPTTYVVGASDSVWDNGVNWSFQTNAPAANWIWETERAEGPADLSDPLYDVDASTHGRVVVFEKKFNINGVPQEGSVLRLAADNGWEVWVNGVYLSRSATVVVGWELSDLHESNLTTSGWQNVGNISVPDSMLYEGENTITILAGNEYFNSDDGNNPSPALTLQPYSQYNPGAMIFSMDVAYTPYILGCIDPGALNYDPEATKDDDSCEYPPPPTGSLTVIKNTIGGDGEFAFTGILQGFSITTVSNTGSKTLSDLAPGTYSVAETVPSGWNLTSNLCENILVVAGQTASCVITNTAQASISGMKYNDLNRNGKKGELEPGLSGWVIKLMLDNDTKDGKDTIIATTITGSDGSYSFQNIVPGTYVVRETHQKGWKRMSKNPKDIVIEAGSVIGGVNFGNAVTKKGEKEDTEKDCDRDEQSGHYYGNHGKSNYDKEQNDKDHQQQDNRGHENDNRNNGHGGSNR